MGAVQPLVHCGLDGICIGELKLPITPGIESGLLAGRLAGGESSSALVARCSAERSGGRG